MTCSDAECHRSLAPSVDCTCAAPASVARRTIRRARSPWWCRSRPAARATWWRASSPSRWRRTLGQIAGDRERRRRRRHARQRPRRGRGARRLHAARRQHGLACRRPGADAERQIRLGARLHPDRSDRAFARRHRRAQGFPGEGPEGVRRAAEGRRRASKQAHGGIGSSSHMACLLFTTEIGAKPTLVAYRGTATGDERPDRRPCRFLLRAVGQRRRAGRSPARSRPMASRRPQRLAVAARRADREGGRRQLPDEHLGRHLRAEGHAARGRGQARRRARQGARRRRRAASASTISAARSPARRSARRRRSTPT